MTIMKTSTSFTTARGVPLEIGKHRDVGQALRAAGLDFTVDSTPISHLTPMDHKYGDKYYAAVRSTDQAILGVNSSRFHHFQPSTLGVLADAVIKIRPDAYVSGGGMSTDERTQFLIVTLDDEPTEGPHGQRNRNIMLANGTNGNRMLQGIAFDFVFTCMNQFPALMRKGGQKLFTLGHTWSANQALPTAIKALQDAASHFDEMDREIELLLTTPLLSSPERILKQVAGTQPDEEGRALTNWEDRFQSLVSEYNSDHNGYAYNTAFGIVMAAQACDEHGSKVQKGQREQQRVGRVLAGNYPLMERALALV